MSAIKLSFVIGIFHKEYQIKKMKVLTNLIGKKLL